MSDRRQALAGAGLPTRLGGAVLATVDGFTAVAELKPLGGVGRGSRK